MGEMNPAGRLCISILLKISLSGQIRIMHIILGSTKRQISPGSPQQEETSALRQPVICALTAVVKLNSSVKSMCGVSVGRKRVLLAP